MDRRDAISRIAIIMGGTMIGAEFMLSGCSPSKKNLADLFTADGIALLDEISDTIIPATDTPGAKDVGAGQLMAIIVRDCYESANQEIFLAGLDKLNVNCKAAYGKVFIDCPPEQRTELLNRLDAEQKLYTKNKSKDQPPHYFRMMKELTLFGYFTSEAGCTKVLRYVPVP